MTVRCKKGKDDRPDECCGECAVDPQMRKPSPVASVILKDTDAFGSMELSVVAIPGGHHLNILAKWIYDRAQNMTEDEEKAEFGNPDGAIGEAKISVSESGDKVRFSIDFGEEGNRDDFNPISHQLACFLVTKAMRKMGQA